MTAQELFLKLNEVIHSDLVHSDSRILVEEGTQATCKEVKIICRGQLATYKFDKQSENIKQLLPFFKDTNSKTLAMCDYVIFCYKGDNFFVFLCNLKSRSRGNTDDQIQAGYLFSNFLVQTAARCFDRSDASNFVKYLAIHFGSGPTNRGTINPKSKAKSIQISSYNNGLKFIRKSCKEGGNLEHLIEALLASND